MLETLHASRGPIRYIDASRNECRGAYAFAVWRAHDDRYAMLALPGVLDVEGVFDVFDHVISDTGCRTVAAAFVIFEQEPDRWREIVGWLDAPEVAEPQLIDARPDVLERSCLRDLLACDHVEEWVKLEDAIAAADEQADATGIEQVVTHTADGLAFEVMDRHQFDQHFADRRIEYTTADR